MISYALQCENGHRFDAWFKNAMAFDTQQASGIVSCAVCGSTSVSKAIMAPALARAGNEKLPLSSGHPEMEKMRDMLRAYREAVTSQADNVGDKFAEEARKIHFEETEARAIFGQATRDEAVALSEEGIEFWPLPDLPEEHN